MCLVSCVLCQGDQSVNIQAKTQRVKNLATVGGSRTAGAYCPAVACSLLNSVTPTPYTGYLTPNFSPTIKCTRANAAVIFRQRVATPSETAKAPSSHRLSYFIQTVSLPNPHIGPYVAAAPPTTFNRQNAPLLRQQNAGWTWRSSL